MRKWLAALAALIFCMTGACAEDVYWTDRSTLSAACADTDCSVLRMVMLGSFSTLDVNDNLNRRVMSAALSPLSRVEGDDFKHFCEEFSEDEALVRQLYYIALGNCLWADILVSPVSTGSTAAARQVLLLFLDPESQPDGPDQIRQIRESLRTDDITVIAEAAGLPADFVSHLLLSADWKQLPGSGPDAVSGNAADNPSASEGDVPGSGQQPH